LRANLAGLARTERTPFGKVALSLQRPGSVAFNAGPPWRERLGDGLAVAALKLVARVDADRGLTAADGAGR
jgi:hypothetical protein